MAKFKMNPDGEEYTPYEDTDGHGEDVGLSKHMAPQHAHGHVTKIEKSEADGHHKVTIEHRHLAEKGEDKEKGAPLGLAEHGMPESSIHLPHGHGLSVGQHVGIHVRPMDEEDETE